MHNGAGILMGNILIISEINSIWTRRCIENSNIIGKNNIYVLYDNSVIIDSFYSENGIILSHFDKKNIWDNVPKIRGLVYRYNYIKHIIALEKKVGHFDVIHVHYINYEKLLAIKHLRPFATRIICTFWGSDLLRASDKKLQKYKKFFNYVDIITMSTGEMKKRFTSVFGNELESKVKLLRFGISNLAYIHPDTDNNIETKQFFSIPTEKTVITIGYNGSLSQNHIEVIEALSSLSDEIKSTLYLQLPLSYGLKPEYKILIKKHLDSSGCEYGLIEEFLNDNNLGKLRESTDVFIHAQKTDASSASVQEYLYARKVVYNPVWIQYRDLKDNNVFYFEYNDYDELVKKLESYLHTGLSEQELENISKNSDIIWNLSSWDSVSKKWEELYKTV